MLPQVAQILDGVELGVIMAAASGVFLSLLGPVLKPSLAKWQIEQEQSSELNSASSCLVMGFPIKVE